MDTRPPPNRNRLPIYLGIGIAAVGGYYLYSAGGNPKVAEKELERDAARLSSAVKSELPGRSKVYQKDAEEYGQRAGAKLDQTIDQAKHKIQDTEARIEQNVRETSHDLKKKIDETDKKIEQAASKTKSGISSFFSSGNK
ncbi:MAG: hypothetical protein M1816_006360 [Peltula sp. TS41687]|nr:MAG: hypothetical protein M1816_006360 [Peltula sp. TS41687]